MKKRPKSLSTVAGMPLADRRLACGLITAALISGSALTSYANESMGGGKFLCLSIS
ncbi:MAG: hypothetical protein NC349_00600 [Paenibacillus sp.]|nr:hypothetical protein [Paenibacillus sp.]